MRAAVTGVANASRRERTTLPLVLGHEKEVLAQVERELLEVANQ